MWKDITAKERKEFNKLATHPLQSYEWGEFREKTGIQVIRRAFEESGKFSDSFQLTIHPIPRTPWTIGYLPKGTLPTKELIDELRRIGKKNKCIFIQLEPNIIKDDLENWKLEIGNWKLKSAAHPLFPKYTLQLDLTLSEDELLAHMHPKARYNIRVAQKHTVMVSEENTTEAFKNFWNLTEETTSRQKFFAHNKKYHSTQWSTLPHTIHPHTLSSHLLMATYEGKPLTAWILFVFNDTLYYPYGASSSQHRETMHSSLMMWEAIRFGKKHKLKKFDLWGATAPNTPASDPWFGFTQFKERFGAKRVEFVGSYDLIINPYLYHAFKFADKLRWLLLRLRK